MLKEVRIRKEGVSIQQQAFASSGIESLYLPPDACVECYDNFGACKDLKTVIIGGGLRTEDCGRMYGLFNGCSSLQTVILPDDMSEIVKDMFDGCMSLRKLYVPEHVESIGERAFYVRGNLTLYAKGGSPAAAYEDDNVSFVNVSGHTHTLKEVMFMKYDTWGVKGKYCEECGYGTEIGMVELDAGVDKDIPMLEVEGNTCPEVLELDEYDTDEQGVIYHLDTVGKTASIVDLDDTRPFPKEIITVPESVEKDGIHYPVEAIERNGLFGAEFIVLPDSVKELERGSVASAEKLVLGKGVENIHSGAFWYNAVDIEIRGENPYYQMIDGVLYTSDKKTLLKRTLDGANYFAEEYKIPTTVTKVMANAFGGNFQLKRIDIYNCGEIEIESSAFEICYAEVCYADGYTWYDPEDTVSDLDRNNRDENGFVYKLNGVYKTADLISIDLSEYDQNTRERTVKIPDWVRKDGRTYKVTTAALKAEDTAPDDIRLRLFIGKYVTEIRNLASYKMTAYNNLENDAFTIEEGSLFDRGRKSLLRFCDENFDCSSTYKLPAETECIENGAFERTGIRKVDTNQVSEIDTDSFSECASLEEVILRREGIHISPFAFRQAKKLEYVYIPCKSSLYDGCFKESGLKTIILGDGVKCVYDSQFAYCKDLETCILPEDLAALTESLFLSCSSIKKLYIPQGVGEVGDNCFTHVTGSIYAQEGGEVEESVKNSGTAQFVSLKNHTHHMERVTFFAFDTWAVTGYYCRECAYAAQCERVELKDEGDRDELPPLLTTEIPVPTSTTAPPQEPTIPAVTASCVPTEMSPQKPPAPTVTLLPAPTETPPQKLPSPTVTSLQEPPATPTQEPTIPTVTASQKPPAPTVTSLPAPTETSSQKPPAPTVTSLPVPTETSPQEPTDPIVTASQEPPAASPQGPTIPTVTASQKPAAPSVTSSQSPTATSPQKPADPIVTVSQEPPVTSPQKPPAPTATSPPKPTDPIVTASQEPPVASPQGPTIPTVTASKGSPTTPPQEPSAPTEAPQQPSAPPTTSPQEPTTPIVTPTKKPLAPTAARTQKPPAPTAARTQEPPASTATRTQEPPAPTATRTQEPPVPTAAATQEPPATLPQEPPAPTAVSPQELAATSEKNLADPTKEPSAPAAGKPGANPDSYRKRLLVAKFKILTKNNKSVRLQWKRNKRAGSYRIYRSRKKKGKYRAIKTVGNKKNYYVDKKIKPALKYYYKVKALGHFDGKAVEGKESPVRSISVSGICNPKISVKKGELQELRYVTVCLRKYQGKYVGIHISIDRKKFKKLKLTSNNISKYNGKFKIQYVIKNKEIRFKVKTYRKKGKKKLYSNFSNIVKVNV